MTSRSSKTEKPTPRRKREARRKGQMPRSPEVAVAASLLGALITLGVIGPAAAGTLAENTRIILAGAGQGNLSGLRPQLVAMVIAVVPILGVGMLAGATSGLVQVGFTAAPAAMKPKLSNLSPRKGLERFKPSVAGWDLGKVITKLGLLAVVCKGPLLDAVHAVAGARSLDLAMGAVGSAVWNLFTRAAFVAVIVAIADYLISRIRSTSRMKMSRQDVRQEHKDQEGDPHLKGARRRRAMEISRNRMIFEVATADVVVTNPTHVAVALKYRPGQAAPTVVAKGSNQVAAKIRGEARRCGVPVIENRPLARSLFRTCRIGSFVPAALFEAVAVVLATAYRRRGRRL